MNATFSPVWHTPCTPDFGHCGCDNCHGDLTDITARIQTFKNRLYILGYDRTKAVWTTLHAIGSGASVEAFPLQGLFSCSYWTSTPTGSQWAAINLISLSHGATGMSRPISCLGYILTSTSQARYPSSIPPSRAMTPPSRAPQRI